MISGAGAGSAPPAAAARQVAREAGGAAEAAVVLATGVPEAVAAPAWRRDEPLCLLLRAPEPRWERLLRLLSCDGPTPPHGRLGADRWLSVQPRRLRSVRERVDAEEVADLLDAAIAACERFVVPPSRWRLAGGWTLVCGRRPLVMGIVNCTPDSFYGGSKARGDEAVRRAECMVRQGADLIDVGGESTRPGSDGVDAATERRRVVPVIRRLTRELAVPVTVDTTKAEVAEAALDAGAAAVNDISGLAYDEGMAGLVARRGAGLVLMHMRGRPREMYAEARYEQVAADVALELHAAVARAVAAGIEREALVVDPGIGFAKRAEHSLQVLRWLPTLRSLGLPILVGPSRKSFIGAVLDLPAEERLEGTLAAVAAAVWGGAQLVRVHDVAAARRVADMAAAIRDEGRGWIC